MSKVNLKSRTPKVRSDYTPPVKLRKAETVTYQGGTPAVKDSPEIELRRAVLSCFLWEDQFYVNGEEIRTRISRLARAVEPEKVAALAIEARHDAALRHVPLALLVALAKTGSGIPKLVADTVEKVVSRPDEAGELLSLYWKENGKDASIPAQFKKGLARVAHKFDQYQLTKWNKDTDIKIRDVMFLTHPNPGHYHKAKLWANFLNKDHYPKNLDNLGKFEKLAPPQTWEVKLSAGEDKKETFEDLLRAGKLGYDALLKNLRNMVEAKVPVALIRDALYAGRGIERIHPFRFFAAAKAAPTLEAEIDQAFLNQFNFMPKLPGKTVIVVDVSGSMGSGLSGKSEMTMLTAACSLAAVLREICEEVSVYATAGDDGKRKHQTEHIPSRRGLPLVDYIASRMYPLGGGGIFLVQVGEHVYQREGEVDRYIVITDEQDTSGRDPGQARIFAKKNYMMNVSSSKPSITFDPRWTKVMGFSSNLAKYLLEIEKYESRQSTR